MTEINRRRLFQATTVPFAIALTVATASSIHAESDFVLDCKVSTHHPDNGRGVNATINAMEAEGRINILASELALALQNREPLPPSYVITLDDGLAIQMGALDLLEKRGKKATFYVMGTNWEVMEENMSI